MAKQVPVRLGAVPARNRDVELGVAPHPVLGDVEAGGLDVSGSVRIPKVRFMAQRIEERRDEGERADRDQAERLRPELVEAAPCRRGRRVPVASVSA